MGILHSLFGEGELLAAHTRVANFFGSFGATFNAMFIGDAWVEFAYPGVFVASCIVGSAVKGLDLYAGTLGRSPVAIALVASAFFGVITLLSTSAFTALLTGGFLLLPVLVLFVGYASRRCGKSLSLGGITVVRRLGSAVFDLSHDGSSY